MSMVVNSAYIHIQTKKNAVIFDEELINELTAKIVAKSTDFSGITSVQGLLDVIEKAVIVKEYKCPLHEFINSVEEEEWLEEQEFLDDEDEDEDEEFVSSYDCFVEDAQEIDNLSDIDYMLILCDEALDGEICYSWILYTPATGLCKVERKCTNSERTAMIHDIIG